MSDLHLSPKEMANILRLQRERDGTEMTPEEVLASLRSTFGKLRTAMRESGFDPPESDMEMRAWLYATLAGRAPPPRRPREDHKPESQP